MILTKKTILDITRFTICCIIRNKLGFNRTSLYKPAKLNVIKKAKLSESFL